MKTRRVIPIKPAPGFSLDHATLSVVRKAIADHRDRLGPLLPILHAVQDTLGYIPKDAVPVIADGLNLSRADVHGVMSFYHYFRGTKPGRCIVHVCRAEACQALGAVALEVHAKRRLGLDWRETSADQRVTLDATYCFGNCALGPSVTVNGELYGRVTPDRLDELLQQSGVLP
jgi:formate dehydrogenase subunit gamma